jgi:hypothetical protein
MFKHNLQHDRSIAQTVNPETVAPLATPVTAAPSVMAVPAVRGHSGHSGHGGHGGYGSEGFARTLRRWHHIRWKTIRASPRCRLSNALTAVARYLW